jgi:hypothetical protein
MKQEYTTLYELLNAILMIMHFQTYSINESSLKKIEFKQ